MDKDLRLLISANASSLLAALTRSKASLREFERSVTSTQSATGRLSESFDNFKGAAKLAMTATGAAAVAGLGSAIKSAGDFESSLSQLKQASGATAQEMQLLNAKARELGKDNSLAGVTASKAAEAMVELSKAGLSVKDTMDAAKGVMSLAKAGNVEYSQAAIIAASALNAFNMKGSEAVKVADALAAGANASQADLSDLALGMQQSATVAKQFKLSLNENVTALSIFANNGIRGSDAGTSLKTMLIALANPSKEAANTMRAIGFSAYDANGKFVGLAEMSNRLQKSVSRLTDQQKQQALATIFGTDAFRAASLLADNAGSSWESMAKEVGKAGVAQEAAAAQQGGYQKALENFSNALSDIGLTIGERLLPPLTDFMNTMSEKVAPTFDFLSANGDKVIMTLATLGGTFATIRVAGFVSDLAKADDVLGMLVGSKNANGVYALKNGIVSLGSGIKGAATWAAGATKDFAALSLSYAKVGLQASIAAAKTVIQTTATIAMTAAQAALNFVMSLNPITLVIIGITALVAAFVLLWVNCEGFRNFFIGMWNGLLGFLVGIWSSITAVFSVVGQFFISAFSAAWNGIVATWNIATGFFSGLWNGVVAIFNGVAGFFGGVFRGAWNAITGVFGGIVGFFGGVWNAVTGMFGKLGGFVANSIGGAVKGAVNGALSIVEGMANGFINTINGAIGIINKIPGVNIGNIPQLHIPRLATGGIVGPQGGGSIIYAGDGGQNEWVVPESKMASLVDQINKRRSGSAGNNVTINNTYHVRDDIDIKRISSDLGYLLSQA